MTNGKLRESFEDLLRGKQKQASTNGITPQVTISKPQLDSSLKHKDPQPGKTGGITSLKWFWPEAEAKPTMTQKPLPVKKNGVGPQTFTDRKPADEVVLDVLTENPGINGSTLVNTLKSKGIGFVDNKEADTMSANAQFGAAGVNPLVKKKKKVKAKESNPLKETKNLTFRSNIFMEATNRKDVDPGKYGLVFKSVLLQEGLGNLTDCYYYTKEALQSAVPLFEGKKIYANHPDKMQEQIRPERDVRDILGHFENVQLESDKDGRASLVADLVILPEESFDWARGLMKHSVSYAQKFPDKEFVGLSINASGDSEETKLDDYVSSNEIPESCLMKIQQAKEKGIETIKPVTVMESAISCDLVTEAGAGGAILKLMEQDKKIEDEAIEGGPGSGRRKSGAQRALDKKSPEAILARLKRADDSRRANATFKKRSDAIKSGKLKYKISDRLDAWAAGTRAAKKAAGVESEVEEATEGGPGSGRHKGGGKGPQKATKPKAKMGVDKMGNSVRQHLVDQVHSSMKKAGIDTDDASPNTVSDHASKMGLSLSSDEVVHGSDTYHKETNKNETKLKPSGGKMEDEVKQSEDEKSEALGDADTTDGGDADHDDAAQDKELVAKMLKKHLGDEETSEEEMEMMQQAFEAYKEMGMEDEKCAEASHNAMKLAKHMQAKQEAADADADEKKEAADGGPASLSPEKKEAEILKLKGKVALLESKIKETETKEYLETVLKKSKLSTSVTKSFREAVGNLKTKAEVDAKFKTFLEGFKAGNQEGGFVISTEKTIVDSSGGSLSFADCKLD